MRNVIAKVSEKELLTAFPIRNSEIGWYFRVNETSNGAYLVEGSDLWGRKVSTQGSDPEKLLKELAIEASKINDKVANT